MPGHARRSRLVALGLSVGGLAGLVAGMVANEHPAPAPPAPQTAAPSPTTVSSPTTITSPTISASDPFAAGAPAAPPSSPPTSRVRRTITSAS